jgi:hypothetical protein
MRTHDWESARTIREAMAVSFVTINTAMKLPERKFTTNLAELSLLTAWHLVTLLVVTSNKLEVAATKGWRLLPT